TPELFGSVVRVSPDAFSDQATGRTYYQAEVLPDEGEVMKLGDQILLPGMPVEAYLRTEDRTPLGYLVKPLTDYFNRAFREG
ncbi:MAG: HlyD family type I secretion periplasmic adaptor subunit, partial [Pseudomonadota bacterium]